MSQRTLFATRFTREQPPVKKSKKRRRAKDGSSIEQVVELQVENNITSSSNDGSNASKVEDKDSKVNNSRSEFGTNRSTNVQHSALTDRASTKAHQDAHYMFGKNKLTIEDGVEKRQDVAMVCSKRLFAAAYHVAKEDLAFSKFTYTLDLLEFCDCPNLVRDLYQNDKACSSFVRYISEDLLTKILLRLNASNFYSITMDESIDIATCQHMIVYVSFIEDSNPVTVILGLLEVAEVLQMSRIHKVRWLSRSMCVHKVCESLEALLIFLKEHNSSLFDKVKDFHFVYSLHFMADILQRLAMLSKIFQSTFVDITVVVGLIEAEMRLITSQFMEVPIVDVNAFVLDGLDYPMIPNYGPRNGQLGALRAYIRGHMYRSIDLERAKCGEGAFRVWQEQAGSCDMGSPGWGTRLKQLCPPLTLCSR
ncbi:hypothetical protein L7F22_018823 [Adiantum nelumboides]|nr:hypothetical protein [Adiantum nelumboides]